MGDMNTDRRTCHLLDGLNENRIYDARGWRAFADRRSRVLKLIERMEARSAKGFRRSPQTPRQLSRRSGFMPRMHAIEPPNLKVEKWDWRNEDVEEIVAHHQSPARGSRRL